MKVQKCRSMLVTSLQALQQQTDRLNRNTHHGRPEDDRSTLDSRCKKPCSA